MTVPDVMFKAKITNSDNKLLQVVTAHFTYSSGAKERPKGRKEWLEFLHRCKTTYVRCPSDCH